MRHLRRLGYELPLHTAIVVVFLSVFPCTGWPDGPPRMDASLSLAMTMRSDPVRMMEKIPGVTMKGDEAYINAFIEMNVIPPGLQDHDVRILSRAGSIYLARLPVANLAAVASLSGVVRMEGDARVEPFLNLSVPEVAADGVWAEGKYGNLRGEGVVVGMVDTGISLRHENFLREGGSGLSRVTWVWDQGDDSGPAPQESCRDYTWDPPQAVACGGTECSPQSEDCDVQDDLNHGTLVMGAMAGNGQAGCGQDLPCTGVAPDAEIIVVKLGNWLVSEVIQGVDYIFQKAAAMGKPAVVNLSLGWYAGPRDGSSLLERSLSNLAGPGRIIVAAAGNHALEMGHARFESDVNLQRRTIYFDCIPTSADIVKVYGWYDPPGAGSVQVRVLFRDRGDLTSWVGFGGSVEADSAYGRITVQHDETSGDARGFTVTLESGVNPLVRDPWHIEVRNMGSVSLGTTVDLWVDRTYDVGPLSGICPLPARFIKAHQERQSTIAPPCTADDVICVGSYNTRCPAGFCTGCSLDYAGIGGLNNCIDGFEVTGAISSFSSLGPTRNGGRRPWLTAPGNAILTPDNRGDDTYSFAGGTSFAAPHVAGTVALMLQADPTLTTARALDALRSSARTPVGVSVWDKAWGWGKLDAYGSVERVASEIPPPPPRPLGGGDDICFIATVAFGDIEAPQVDRLREMRDRFLFKTSPGRQFVRFYYRWSPDVAAWLKGHAVGSGIVRLFLMPAVGWSEMVYHRSAAEWAGLSVLGLFLASALCCFSYRCSRRIR